MTLKSVQVEQAFENSLSIWRRMKGFEPSPFAGKPYVCFLSQGTDLSHYGRSFVNTWSGVTGEIFLPVRVDGATFGALPLSYKGMSP